MKINSEIILDQEEMRAFVGTMIQAIPAFAKRFDVINIPTLELLEIVEKMMTEGDQGFDVRCDGENYHVIMNQEVPNEYALPMLQTMATGFMMTTADED
jgi:hypothetical protein